jgi:hypothetical protein
MFHAESSATPLAFQVARPPRFDIRSARIPVEEVVDLVAAVDPMPEALCEEDVDGRAGEAPFPDRPVAQKPVCEEPGRMHDAPGDGPEHALVGIGAAQAFGRVFDLLVVDDAVV